jgi:hypothetical protein
VRKRGNTCGEESREALNARHFHLTKAWERRRKNEGRGWEGKRMAERDGVRVRVRARVGYTKKD